MRWGASGDLATPDAPPKVELLDPVSSAVFLLLLCGQTCKGLVEGLNYMGD